MASKSPASRKPVSTRAVAGARQATGRRAQPGRAAAAREDAPVAQAPEGLLRASLNPFRLENLLGLTPPAAGRADAPVAGLGFGALDSFGFRKFEDVLDQRVASALRHLGWPEPQALHEMQAELARLRAELEELRRSTRKQPRSKPAQRGGRRPS